jgi:polyisoprenoid-binding protein YceI
MSTSTARGVLPVGTWTLDPVHTHVGFAVDYMVGTFRGSFSPVEASLVVADDGSASLTGSAAVAGVRVQDENLGAHLQSPDFFDAERTPQIKFKSTDISVDGDEVTVAGELSIKGRGVPVTATGTLSEPVDVGAGERFALTLETQIDRTRFGLNWNNPLPSGKPALANAVTLTAELYFAQA